MIYDMRHGGPYDRGSADAYYGRPCKPHYYVGATHNSQLIEEQDMSDDQIEAYNAGYNDQVDSGDYKDWGR